MAAKTYRLDQLDEEIRVALGESQRRGLTQAGEPQPTVLGDPLTDAQATTVIGTMAAHIPNQNWGELNDVRACRIFLGDAALDAFLGLVPGTATAVQRDDAIQKLIRSQRALIRVVRGLAT